MVGRRKVEKPKVIIPEVVEDNIRPEEVVVAESGETVTIACHLSCGLIFDDVPDGNGGYKIIRFPSINDHLKGEKTGILVGEGKAVAITLSKSDWNAIKAKHGREQAFNSFKSADGVIYPPCLIEMKNRDEFRARKNEVIAEMKHGLEPAPQGDVV